MNEKKREKTIVKDNPLDGKKILVVDDEPDVLESLLDLLPMCRLKTAQTFEQGRDLLEAEPFDIAILDIMGVDGYELLNLAGKKGIIGVMLTANALSVDDTVKSFKKGAASYIPKEKMIDIEIFLQEVLEAHQKGKGFMDRWMDRFNSYYEKKFGSDWKEGDKEFWEKHGYWL